MVDCRRLGEGKFAVGLQLDVRVKEWQKPQGKFGNNLGTKPGVLRLVLGFDSHKGSRIIKQLAEACGSRTQAGNSQLTANEDVAASAFLQLES